MKSTFTDLRIGNGRKHRVNAEVDKFKVEMPGMRTKTYVVRKTVSPTNLQQQRDPREEDSDDGTNEAVIVYSSVEMI